MSSTPLPDFAVLQAINRKNNTLPDHNDIDLLVCAACGGHEALGRCECTAIICWPCQRVKCKRCSVTTCAVCHTETVCVGCKDVACDACCDWERCRRCEGFFCGKCHIFTDRPGCPNSNTCFIHLCRVCVYLDHDTEHQPKPIYVRDPATQPTITKFFHQV